jgi:hypothetical protein
MKVYTCDCLHKKSERSQALWLMLIILATQEGEIRMIVLQGQARQKVSETHS